MCEFDDEPPQLDGNTAVFNEFTINYYLHGRCHLFALVANKIFGLPIQWLWDLNPEYDGEPENSAPRAALGHVWLTLENNEVMDASGVLPYSSMIATYEPLCWDSSIGYTDAEGIKNKIKNNVLNDFLPGEEQAITNFITSNKAYYEST